MGDIIIGSIDILLEYCILLYNIPAWTSSRHSLVALAYLPQTLLDFKILDLNLFFIFYLIFNFFQFYNNFPECHPRKRIEMLWWPNPSTELQIPSGSWRKMGDKWLCSHASKLLPCSLPSSFAGSEILSWFLPSGWKNRGGRRIWVMTWGSRGSGHYCHTVSWGF